MKPERWQQVSRILELALERTPERRAAYLDEACVNDGALRQEVESLLAASARAGSLLDSPAMEMAAPLFADDPKLMIGQSVGRYQIVSALGAGGMGEVYLAHDTRLGRRIALKLLPAHLTTDQDRLRRFEQEAHAASTLSHPNVCVIHEIGEAENARRYIAMEYVDGVTLRRHLSGARLKPTEALDVAVQVAAALAAAHAAGVVHRDIKPENIMVRPDGIIKVLDFGLAKFTEQWPTIDSQTATKALVQTDTGVVMGTATYMSPEQARGLAVDERTDIWSLGVVLYEMIAGRAPFDGATASDLIAAILKTEPPPLTDYSAEAPSELAQVISKALQKEQEARHQTVGELLNDLKEIKQGLEFQAKLGRSIQTEARDQANAAGGSKQAELQTARVEASHTDGEKPARKTSSFPSGLVPNEGWSFAAYFISESRRHKLGAFVSLIALFGVIGALGYGIFRLVAPRESNAHFQKVRFSRLTTNGHVADATVSPDGKFIGYVQLEGGKYSLWTKAVATDSTLQILQPSEGKRIYYTTFSPDSDYLYYAVVALSGSGVLYRIPVLGGTPRMVLTKIDSRITFSPDGKQLAFVRKNSDSGETQLVVVNTDGSGERIVARSPGDEGFSDGGPSWSPDGKIIATGLGRAGVQRQWIVVGVGVESGEVKPLSQQSWNFVGRVAWFRDGTGLVLRAIERQGDKGQLWQLSYPEGVAHPVTSDLNNYINVSLTADSNAMVTLQSQASSNIWVAPNGDAGQARQLTSSSNADEGTFGAAWTPDGSIVYSSNAGGNRFNLWIMDGDGGNPRRLTDSPAEDYLPAVSPDGRYIVFMSNRSGKGNIWRVEMDGGNPKQLTNDVGDFPVFAPDGRWIACTLGNYMKATLWRIPVDGGSPVRLTDTPAYVPAVSSDGKLIAYFYFDESIEKKTKVAIISSEGGTPLKTLDCTPTPNSGLQWSPDDSALIYVDARQGGANLWRLPLDGGPARQLTDFKSEQIRNFNFTRDGRRLVCARGTTTNDVVMISEAK